jgi:thiamine-phosphate pyrophosphorylase
MIQIPRLYAIIDSSCFSATEALVVCAQEVVLGGCTLLQYRNKSGNARQMLDEACELKRALGRSVRLIMNDRADLCLAAEFDGVHVGQDDLSPESVRKIIGPKRWLGVSTHNAVQVQAANQTSADYIAVGPIFATSSKANLDPIVGLAGVQQVRTLTQKPLVAIGGITRSNCRSVLEAGADSVAVISDLLRDPRKSVQDFLSVFG